MSLEKNIKELYEKGYSTLEIAENLNISQSKALRTLKKMGVKLRSRSEAAKISLERGVSVSPTKGKKHTQEARERMSKAREEAWVRGGEKAREEMSEMARERWKNKPIEEIAQMRSNAGRALQEAARKGSAAEKFLVDKLRANGYAVEHHNKNIVIGEYEIDIFLPDEKVIIEIDGPHHFLPIYGEERLLKSQEYDLTKNGALISKGFTVIRIKYLAKKFNASVGRNMWNACEKALNDRQSNLIYVEF